MPAFHIRSRWRNKKEWRPQNHSGWALSCLLGEQSEIKPGSLSEPPTPGGRSTAPGKGFLLPLAARPVGAARRRGLPGSVTTQFPPAFPQWLHVATRPSKISAHHFCRWGSHGLGGLRVHKDQLSFPLHTGLWLLCWADQVCNTAQQLCSSLHYP